MSVQTEYSPVVMLQIFIPKLESNKQLTHLNFPSTEFLHPTNLGVQIEDINIAGFMKICKDNLSHWPL